MKLIVGLGNPGDKYAGTRHNIGFMAADEIARGYSFGPWKKRFQGHAAEGQIGVEKCILLKPATYMNESGRSAGEAMRFYKVSVGDVIAVHDELDLKPGMIRVKTGGGNAGHNGLKSISAHIGNDYIRVRLGIGHPGDKALVANYVLQDFAKSDREWVLPLLEGVARGMVRLVEGSEAAFLSEAARGRSQPAQAAKTNGASAPTPDRVLKPEVLAAVPKVEAAAAVPKFAGISSDAEDLAVIAAAAARPIKAMPVAVRGGGGAVSTAVMMPEPRPHPAPVAAQPAMEVQPVVESVSPAIIVAEPVLPPAPVVEEAPPFTASTPIEWAEAAPEETSSPVMQPAAENKVQTAPEPQKKGGIFGGWFRSRGRSRSPN